VKLGENLGAPALGIPEIAYRRPDAYHSGADLAPRKDVTPYQEYKFLGRFPLELGEMRDAKAAAREKYGPKARVFRTGRHWVAYEVQ
jgi:hypothetical protein